MRPRVFPAENVVTESDFSRGVTGFNEAAGIPRGKRVNDDGWLSVVQASMRPRVFPAENE